MKTLTEVTDFLKHLDEITLLEVLNISSEEIVERFSDVIEDQYEWLAKELEDEEREY